MGPYLNPDPACLGCPKLRRNKNANIYAINMSDDAEKKEMNLKVYRQGAEVLVAVCDCDLLGKKFAEGRLRVEVDKDFFGEEKASPEEVEAALKKATIANFVGCCAVEQAIRLGYVERENVLCIDGVLCAQMVRM